MNTHKKQTSIAVQIIKIILLVYVLLISISLLSFACKLFGSDFALMLIRLTNNPFLGLLIGTFVTSLIHSSSTTTSITVGMVASGVLTVRNAVPIIMGANIGTTVTNITISLAHITRKEEFKRAFAGALMHDLFNIFTVLILFPLELMTHVLENTATVFAQFTFGHETFLMINPVKLVTKLPLSFFSWFCFDVCKMPDFPSGIILLSVALGMLFFSLFFISHIARVMMGGKTEIMIDRALVKAGWMGILLGMLITSIIQSSSVTTSTLVPLIGAGILSLESAFPITLGANIGTTVTALLASLTGDIAAVTIGFTHLLFNWFGVLLIYPIPFIRNIPIRLARFLGEKATNHRKAAVIFIVFFFYILPALLAWVIKF